MNDTKCLHNKDACCLYNDDTKCLHNDDTQHLHCKNTSICMLNLDFRGMQHYKVHTIWLYMAIRQISYTSWKKMADVYHEDAQCLHYEDTQCLHYKDAQCLHENTTRVHNEDVFFRQMTLSVFIMKTSRCPHYEDVFIMMTPRRLHYEGV